ncbi:MAG: peptidylprolyl isomerase [Campylobacterales bacterium]|nr:peptidylprolyl isomerase [Campylobacterales bacterium]
MQTIQKNTLVSISLKLEDEDGNLLDQSDELMYLHGGYQQIFQKLEDTLEGKTINDTFRVLLNAKDAFGEYQESLHIQEALEDLPEDVAVGMELDGEDEEIVWYVEKIEDGYATLNANHELAGINMWATGEVLELEALSEAAVEEILHMEHEH